MNLPGEPDEQKEKTKIQPFIRKISKHHFDTQKKSYYVVRAQMCSFHAVQLTQPWI